MNSHTSTSMLLSDFAGNVVARLADISESDILDSADVGGTEVHLVQVNGEKHLFIRSASEEGLMIPADFLKSVMYLSI